MCCKIKIDHGIYQEIIIKNFCGIRPNRMLQIMNFIMWIHVWGIKTNFFFSIVIFPQRMSERKLNAVVSSILKYTG